MGSGADTATARRRRNRGRADRDCKSTNAVEGGDRVQQAGWWARGATTVTMAGKRCGAYPRCARRVERHRTRCRGYPRQACCGYRGMASGVALSVTGDSSRECPKCRYAEGCVPRAWFQQLLRTATVPPPSQAASGFQSASGPGLCCHSCWPSRRRSRHRRPLGIGEGSRSGRRGCWQARGRVGALGHQEEAFTR